MGAFTAANLVNLTLRVVLAAVLAPRLGIRMAVSYTHLDVYKRQCHNSSPTERPGPAGRWPASSSTATPVRGLPNTSLRTGCFFRMTCVVPSLSLIHI